MVLLGWFCEVVIDWLWICMGCVIVVLGDVYLKCVKLFEGGVVLCLIYE